MALKNVIMKKVLVSALTFLFVVFIAQGQAPKTEKMQAKGTKKEVKSTRVPLKKLAGKEINPVAMANFKVDFPNVQGAQWSKADYFDQASFTKDGVPMMAYYDFDGKLVGTTSIKKFTDLPVSAQNRIKTEYKDYNIGKVLFFDDNEENTTDMYMYGNQFDDADVYFVELEKAGKITVIQVNPDGHIFLFADLK